MKGIRPTACVSKLKGRVIFNSDVGGVLWSCRPNGIWFEGSWMSLLIAGETFDLWVAFFPLVAFLFLLFATEFFERSIFLVALKPKLDKLQHILTKPFIKNKKIRGVMWQSNQNHLLARTCNAREAVAKEPIYAWSENIVWDAIAGQRLNWGLYRLAVRLFNLLTMWGGRRIALHWHDWLTVGEGGKSDLTILRY